MFKNWQVIVLLVLTFSIAVARGGGITWGSELFASASDSENQPLDSNWTFYLGYFDSGFIPSAENTAEWASHWTTLDVSSYAPLSGFSSTWIHDEMSTGRKGYIWGANRSLPANEWILMSASTWSVPPFDSLIADVDWISSDANEVIVGEVSATGEMVTSVGVGEPPFLSGDHWRELYFSDAEQNNALVSDWDADSDGDGMSNLAEFAFGTQPKRRDRVEVRLTIEGGFFQFETQRARNVGVLYFAQISENLEQWSEGNSFVTLEEESPSSLTYRSTVTNAAAPKQFGRLRVALQP